MSYQEAFSLAGIWNCSRDGSPLWFSKLCVALSPALFDSHSWNTAVTVEPQTKSPQVRVCDGAGNVLSSGFLKQTQNSDSRTALFYCNYSDEAAGEGLLSYNKH